MNDKWFYRGIVLALGLVAVGTIVLFAWKGEETPDAVLVLGSAAVGALGGMFK